MLRSRRIYDISTFRVGGHLIWEICVAADFKLKYLWWPNIFVKALLVGWHHEF